MIRIIIDSKMFQFLSLELNPEIAFLNAFHFY